MNLSGFGEYGKDDEGGYAEAMDELRRLLTDVHESAVKAARQEVGISQSRLALKTGYSQPHLSDIETGRRPLTSGAARKIATVLGVEARELEAAQVLVNLKSLGDDLDAEVLLHSIMYLQERLPENSEHAEELLQTLLDLLEARVAELQTTRDTAGVAMKSKEQPRRDRDGRRKNKPYSPPEPAHQEPEGAPRRDSRGRRLYKINDPRNWRQS